MLLIQNIILELILIIFPFTIYLLLQVYSKTLNKEKNELYLDITLISSFYFIAISSKSDYISLLLMNIPLILAYITNRKFSTGLLFLGIILYYYNNIDIPIYLIIIEYIIFYLGYILLHKKYKYIIYILIFVYSLLFLFQYNYIFNINYIEIILSTISFNLAFFLIVMSLKKTEEILKLYKTIEELQKETQIRDSLFKITHEIKNPIAVCKGYLDMYDVNNLEHSRKYIPIIKSEIERILVLLKDFLSIKKINIEPDIIDIGLIIEEVINNFMPLIENKKIKIIYSNKEEFYVFADYNRLKQVFINMLKNSIEALDNKKYGKIEINIKENKNNICISFADNGCGITKEDLKHMNEPFFTTKRYGTGLGVFLSREIIKAHNGNIEYKSDNNGTTAYIKIPNKKGY